MALELKDAIDLAIHRSDAYIDLWKFYATIIAASVTVVGVAPIREEKRRLFHYGIPLIFLVCALSNLAALLEIGDQRLALLGLAQGLAPPSVGVNSLLASLAPSGHIVLVIFHGVIDLTVTAVLFLATARSERESSVLDA